MRDEEYVYYQDLKEKKSTGYSARKQRSHCGKGGRVKLPSDYLTKKELKNMSGECKSYRLNEPMQWKEFKAMPDDIQITYINLLLQKWNVPVSAIAKMMGGDRANLSKYLHDKLGFDNFPRGKHSYDKQGFMEWCYGVPKTEESVQEEEMTSEEAEEVLEILGEVEPVLEETKEEEETMKESEIRFKKVIPTTGSMTYEGMTFDILSSISDLLGNAKVLLSVKWDVVTE